MTPNFWDNTKTLLLRPLNHARLQCGYRARREEHIHRVAARRSGRTQHESWEQVLRFGPITDNGYFAHQDLLWDCFVGDNRSDLAFDANRHREPNVLTILHYRDTTGH